MSVILPAFNAQRYLPEAIGSILGQRFGDFEFLIVDDGSTDATREIIVSYDDPRVRLIVHERNLGLTRSLNHALTLARGEYIARQDADDVSEPQRLECQVACLDQRPEIALLGSCFTAIDASGAVLRRTPLPLDDLDIRWAMFFYCPFVHTAVMWRHALVREHVGAYDERFSYAQDHELWARIASHFSVANVGAFLVRYREHGHSMTETYGERALEGYRLHLAAVRDALGWNESRPAETESRFRVLAALLRESQITDVTAQEARRGVVDMLALQAELCRRNRANPRAAARHRRLLRARISRGLVRLGQRSADQGRTAEARRLLAAAYRVYWPALARRSAGRLAARVLSPQRQATR